MRILYNIRRKYIEPDVVKRDIALSVVSLPANSYQYTGSPITPTPTVKLEGETLTVNVDYVVSYESNINIGEASVIITGIGDYVGTKTVTFYVTKQDTSTPWTFNLIGVGVTTSVAARYDSEATYCPNQPLKAISMQLLPDGNLHFAANPQGHCYILGFAEGHNFEVRYLNQVATRSRSWAYLSSGLFSEDGRRFYVTYGGFTYQSEYLTTAFDWDTVGTMTRVEGLTVGAQRAKFSRNGLHFYYGENDYSYTIYHRKLQTPFVLTSYDSSIEPENSFTFDYNVSGFDIAPDNKSIVVVDCDSKKLAHYGMTTEGDISSLTLSSKMRAKIRRRTTGTAIATFEIGIPRSLVIDNDGRKAIVWGCDNSGLLFELNLPEVGAFTVPVIEDQYYTGSEVRPNPSIQIGTTGDVGYYEKDVDYELSYSNNVNIGTGCLCRITGIGECASFAPVNVRFNIISPQFSTNGSSLGLQEYTGYPVEVSLVGLGLTGSAGSVTRGIDYNVVYNDDHTSTGSHTLTIQGIGAYQYADPITLSYTIVRRNYVLTHSDPTKRINVNWVIISANDFNVRDTSGIPLREGFDYNVTSADLPETLSGFDYPATYTHTYTISGLGSYAGQEVTATLTIIRT